MVLEPVAAVPQILPSCGSERITQSCDSNSFEFEFWMAGNPFFPLPNLPSADELFSGGFLLPLDYLLSNPKELPSPPPADHDHDHDQDAASDQEFNHFPEFEASIPESSVLLESPRTTTLSKRWMDIFKRSSSSSGDVNADGDGKEKDSIRGWVREKTRDKKNAATGGVGNGLKAPEPYISIWPFSRSRSAGVARQVSVEVGRKASSEPCSRSNSVGESKSRKWPGSSPAGRAGVHLGRSSRVWQAHRGCAGGCARSSDAITKRAQKGAVKNDLNENSSVHRLPQSFRVHDGRSHRSLNGR